MNTIDKEKITEKLKVYIDIPFISKELSPQPFSVGRIFKEPKKKNAKEEKTRKKTKVQKKPDRTT